MALPLHLVLVRHGESVGNQANAASRAGDHSLFTAEFRKRHAAWWELTERGRAQAAVAGDWIRQNILGSGVVFDRLYTSSYTRAMETAALLGIDQAQWLISSDLRERSIGDMEAEILSVPEMRERFAGPIAARDGAPYYWRPPNGESLADVALRLRQILGSLHRESATGALLVCHGEVMLTFHKTLTHMSDRALAERIASTDRHHVIFNCQVHHYSRVDPQTGAVSPYLGWWRSVCPTNLEWSSNDWEAIERPRYSNDDLLRMARQAAAPS